MVSITTDPVDEQRQVLEAAPDRVYGEHRLPEGTPQARAELITEGMSGRADLTHAEAGFIGLMQLLKQPYRLLAQKKRPSLR